MLLPYCLVGYGASGPLWAYQVGGLARWHGAVILYLVAPGAVWLSQN